MLAALSSESSHESANIMPSWFTPDWWIDFDAPEYLWLLVIVPLIWFLGRRSLSALGGWRQKAAIFFRMAVATLIVVALAEPNWLAILHRLTVLFVVDASDSIRSDELGSVVNYINAAAQQRNSERGDRAGVVVFGREASIEVPPLDHDWRLAKVESEYDPRFTNLEAALKMAKATFPPDAAKRVVIISDGNENAGRALPQARELLDAGVGIDCVPISYKRHGDVRVEKVAVPADVRRGTPFLLRVILDNLTTDRTIPGKLRITRSLGGVEHLVTEEPLQLAPGKRVLSVAQELDEVGMSTYEARFVPDNPADDLRSENNVATGFCRIGGRGHVLVIEEATLAGRFDSLVQLLRTNDIEVTVRDSRRPFDDLTDLQQFDCVILADVARVAGEGSADLTQFSDSQINALVQNTEHFGCGLIVLGGPNSYGAGGWTNTELEKALPVSFQIDNAKVEAIGALMLVIDSSGSMTGPKIEWSKAAAVAASQMLGKRDYLGVVSFDSEPHWIVPLRRNETGAQAQSRIRRLSAGGGTDMMPALREAYRAIQKIDASLKHVIVLTDGQTPKTGYASLVSRMHQQGITSTGVAIGPDADRLLLADIGRRGGGKFYQVLSPKAIPRIFMREARRVAMPLVFEDRDGIPIQLADSSELLSGITSPPPPISGYVLTTVKEDPLVEVLLNTPRQLKPNSTILATWQYGLGRAAALTTDLGQRWAADWPAWGNYEKLLLQLVRSTMRNHEVQERLVMTADARDGNIDIVVNATDQEDAFLDFLDLSGTVVLPDGESQSFSVEQIAPGRYTARIPARDPGNYFLSVAMNGRGAPLRAAIRIPFTAELDDLVSQDGFLAELAEGQPRGGDAGILITSARGLADTSGLISTDVFRPGLAPAQSRDAMWPVVIFLASGVFLADVFCRRVLLTFDWLAPVLRRWRHRGESAQAATSQLRIERLKQTKHRATARYVASDRLSGDDISKAHATDPAPTAAPATVQPSSEPARDSDGDSPEFTARLLAAKKQLRDSRQPPK